MDVIVGTAGHIDHGKTALVKALTGVDADRLPEEKQRGITIDLGFAELQIGDVRIGFVDVPGHERFVKNMLAGASGIDLLLLVVAADEGVMPQTREHFDICRLLTIKAGVIVLTKVDLADEDTLELARLDAAELVRGSFLEGAPVFEVSSRTGQGLDQLKEGLGAAARNVQRETDNYETRLPIDRSFSVKGFGAVVTGTLASGEVVEGDELELMPVGRRVRVRGVQTHGRAVRSAHAGQRTAVNLGGIDHDEVARGMTLARPGSLAATSAFDAEIEMLADAVGALRSRQRVRVHLGTAEVLARVSVLNAGQIIEPGSTGFVQLRLESPLAAAFGDRFIIRSYSPQRTIAGGRIVDPLAERHRRTELDGLLHSYRERTGPREIDVHSIENFVSRSREKTVSVSDLRSRTGLRDSVLGQLVQDALESGTIRDAGGWLIEPSVVNDLMSKTLEAIEKHHREDKLSRGLPRETLREQVFRRTRGEVFRFVISELENAGKVALDGDVVRLASYTASLSPAEQAVHEKLAGIYDRAGLEVPKLDEALREAAAGKLDAVSARKVFQLFVNSGELVAVTNEYYFLSAPLNELIENLRRAARESGESMLDVARFKEIAGVSRKYAIPLLEYLDRERVTRRVGDKRQIL